MRILVSMLFASVLMVSPSANSADADEARKAADAIVASLSSSKIDRLWETQTSNWYKTKVKKEAFVPNMTIARTQMGPIHESKFMSMDFAQKDPSTGYEGEIYAFTYLNAYAVGKFYERIVVIKEGGSFKLSGLHGAPAQ